MLEKIRIKLFIFINLQNIHKTFHSFITDKFTIDQVKFTVVSYTYDDL